MGEPLRIIWNNRHFDAAVLTASSAVATLPAANLQDVQRKRVLRSIGVGTWTVTIDFGESIYRTCMALINHNFTFAATVRVQASDAADFGTLLKNDLYNVWEDIIGYGEGGMGVHGYGGAILESERKLFAPEPIRIIYFEPEEGADHVKARYWRWEFEDAANPDDYFEIGRAYLCLYDAYGKQFSWSWPYGG